MKSIKRYQIIINDPQYPKTIQLVYVSGTASFVEESLEAIRNAWKRLVPRYREAWLEHSTRKGFLMVDLRDGRIVRPSFAGYLVEADNLSNFSDFFPPELVDEILSQMSDEARSADLATRETLGSYDPATSFMLEVSEFTLEVNKGRQVAMFLVSLNS